MSKQDTFVEYDDYNPCTYTIRFKQPNYQAIEDPPISHLSNWMEVELIHAFPGEVEVKFRVTSKLTNPAKILHGGLQCAIIDEVIGMTGATLGLNHFLFAIDMKVDYLRQAKLGEDLHVKGRVIKKGRHIVNCIGEIYTEDCKLIAQAKSNLFI
jgi:acyl-coenzyme A thioesterase 13